MRAFLKIHKWLGLPLAFFLIIFSLSGVFLNHRQGISTLDVSRSILPNNYKYENWNNSAIKGSFQISKDSIILYGGSGIWLTDSLQSDFTPLMDGMLVGADNRNTINIIKTNENDIFAITTFDLYKLNLASKQWIRKTDLLTESGRLADITHQNDTLVVLNRSHAYISVSPYQSFEKIELQAPEDYKNEVPLFKTFWTLHSGELFGFAGKLFVDFIGVIFIILSVTGIILLFCPSLLKKVKEQKTKKRFSGFLKTSSKWHNKLGAWFLVFSIIVILSGIFLRPPAMIFIIRDKTEPIPGTVYDTPNPWFEKLRNIRYDNYSKDWFIYTSDGFYQMKNLTDQPVRIQNAPRVSVMGVNVLEEIAPNLWVVGSFSGLHYWERRSGMSVDISQMRPIFLDGTPVRYEHVESQRGIMSGIDVSGYTSDFPGQEIVFSYSSGALSVGKPQAFTRMPDAIKDTRMSLWHLSLEAHVGRIYTPIVNGIMGESYFILFTGLGSLIVFITGYIVYYKRKVKRKKLKE